MINYRLSSAVSVHGVLQTSVQTRIHFVGAGVFFFAIFPAVSFQYVPTCFFTSIAHYNSAPLDTLLHEKLSPVYLVRGMSCDISQEEKENTDLKSTLACRKLSPVICTF